MENVIKLAAEERQERRETDTVIFRLLGEIKDKQEENKDNLNAKVSEVSETMTKETAGIKQTMARWGGIAFGAIFFLEVAVKLFEYLKK